MLKHHFLNLLSTFSKDDLKEFNVFLHSPYFNKSNKLISLYNYIIKFHPEFNNVKLSKEMLYRKISPGKKYVDSTIRDLLSKLYHLVLKFICMRKINSDKIFSGNLLIEELVKISNKPIFEMHAQQFKNELLGNKVESSSIYEMFKFSSNCLNNKIKNEKITNLKYAVEQVNDTNETFETLTIYYITEAVCFYINLLVYKLNYNIEVPGCIDVILDKLEPAEIMNNRFKNNRLSFILDIYSKLYYTFKYFDVEKYYYEYKKSFLNGFNRLTRSEISFHYSKIIAYCIIKNKLSKNNITFKQELLKYYSLVIFNEYYKDNNTLYLPLSLFRNIIKLALELNKIALAETFIKDSINKIDPHDKCNMFNYGMAHLYRAKNNFELCLEHTNNIKLTYFIYKYDIKLLKSVAFYELNYFEEVYCILHSFKEVLRKDKFLDKERKAKYNNFIKYLEYLLKQKEENGTQYSGKMLENLLKLNNIIEKPWLIEKIKSIKSYTKN